MGLYAVIRKLSTLFRYIANVYCGSECNASAEISFPTRNAMLQSHLFRYDPERNTKDFQIQVLSL